MRKSLLLLICVLFFLSACSAGSGYSQDDLSLYNTKTKEEIRLGMTLEEIKSVLGDSFSETEYFPYYEAPGVSIGFRDGAAVLFAIRKTDEDDTGSSDTENYRTARGITINSSYEEFQKKYPTSIRQGNNLQFYLLHEEEGYTDITASFVEDKKPYQDDFSSVYYINFGNPDASPDAAPSSIYVGDFRAIFMADVDKK